MRQLLQEKQERIQKQKEEDSKRVEQYQKQLKEVTLKTFKDRPDAVSSIRCVHSEATVVAIEWDAPESNNSPITQYHVYLSQTKLLEVSTLKFNDDKQEVKSKDHIFEKIASISSNDLYYNIENLVKDSIYYVRITAEND